MVKIASTQLSQTLKKELSPVYLVYGDEPLQLNECCDLIRSTAAQQQYDGREIFHVETGFDWNSLLEAANSLSLFSERRIIELRMANNKAGDKGSKAILEYLERIPEDTILLVICGKLDAQALKSKWISQIIKSGVVVQARMVTRAQLPAWVSHRMQQKGVHPDSRIVTMIAERAEGNLLTAAQEIDKLYLMYGNEKLQQDQVDKAISDTARFDIYGLTDSALEGDSARTLRILKSLREEGVEPVLLLWALTREIRALYKMAFDRTQGEQIEKLMVKYRIWQNRQQYVRKALNRHDFEVWSNLLQWTAHIDRVIKGVDKGWFWIEIESLVLAVTGQKAFFTQTI